MTGSRANLKVPRKPGSTPETQVLRRAAQHTRSLPPSRSSTATHTRYAVASGIVYRTRAPSSIAPVLAISSVSPCAVLVVVVAPWRDD